MNDGFERKLEIQGHRLPGAACQGKNLQLALGYSHPIDLPAARTGCTAEVEKQVGDHPARRGQGLLGQTAAQLRALRKPDPYKGKGIRYAGEVVRRKVGKTGAK